MMRYSVFVGVTGIAVMTASIVVACGGSSGGGGGSAPDDEAGVITEGGTTTGDGAVGSDGGSPVDASRPDGATDIDGAIPDDGGIIPGGDPPSVQMIGRFEADGANFDFAFPGSKLIARFNGTDATVTLSQTDGFSVGHSYFNVVVDGVLQPSLLVNGTSVAYPVAVGLPAGAHTVELEKRTEANLGVVRYEGFTFPNGGTLLGPPARSTRRIEFLSDSTIDGFGIAGSRLSTAPPATFCGDPSSAATNYGALPQFDNARQSVSAVTANTLAAEEFLIAYSGKGLTKNDVSSDTLLYPTIYGRAIPDSAGSVWAFGMAPQAVVISLGGVDLDGVAMDGAGYAIPPQAFIDAYGALIDRIRTNYPDAWIFMTVWSQIKDDTPPKIRTPLTNVIAGLISARPADTKLSSFVFPEAMVDVDETGCEYHGNITHHANMAALLSAQIKTTLGW